MRFYFIFSVILCITIILPILLTMAPPSTETSSTGTSSMGTSSTGTTYSPTFPPCNPNFEVNVSMPFYPSTMSNNLQYVNGLYYVSALTNTSGYGNITIIGPVYNYTISNIFTNNDAFTLIVDNRTNDVYLFGFFQYEQQTAFNSNFYGIKFNYFGVEQWRTPQFNRRLEVNTVLDQTKNVISVYNRDIKYDVSLSTGLIVQTYSLLYEPYRATLNYYLTYSPNDRVCRMNLTDGSNLWCVNLPWFSAMVEDSNYVYIVSETSNYTGSYFIKIDTSGNIVLTSQIQNFFGLWEGNDYTNPVTYYNGYLYTMLNDCYNFTPCGIFLAKTDVNTGISTFQQFFYTGTRRADFVLVIDQTSNTLYFASSKLPFSAVDYRINTFCL